MARGNYPFALKESVVKRYLSDPENRIGEFSKENGIPETCLRNWIREAEEGILHIMSKKKDKRHWDLNKKLQVLLEYKGISDEVEQGKWLRKKGLKSEHIDAWRKEIENALGNKPTKEEKARIKELEKDIRKKDKALAEVTALLVMKKKAQAIWGDGEEED
jgi:transposase-like protein